MPELADISQSRACSCCGSEPGDGPFPENLLLELEQDVADGVTFAPSAMKFVLAQYRRVCGELADLKAVTSVMVNTSE